MAALGACGLFAAISGSNSATTATIGSMLHPEMVKGGYGRIVNLSSAAGVLGGTGRAAYGAAKGGVISLTRVMAVELASRGVTVNALTPGAIETELVARMHSAKTREVYTKATPADRYGTPTETAWAALFLASEQAGYVTGNNNPFNLFTFPAVETNEIVYLWLKSADRHVRIAELEGYRPADLLAP